MGRHDQVLQQIMDTIQTLTTNVYQLGQQVTVLSMPSPAPLSPLAPTVSNPSAATSDQPTSPPQFWTLMPPL